MDLSQSPEAYCSFSQAMFLSAFSSYCSRISFVANIPLLSLLPLLLASAFESDDSTLSRKAVLPLTQPSSRMWMYSCLTAEMYSRYLQFYYHVVVKVDISMLVML